MRKRNGALIANSRRWTALGVVLMCAGSIAGGSASAGTSGGSPDQQRIAPQAPVETRTVSVRIERPFAEVYDFLVRPENWNQWATGLGKSIHKTPMGWVAETDQGESNVRFTPRNSFGVVDHYVMRRSGPEVYVPMRLIANGEGCELLFTLFREVKMSDEQYDRDMEFVKKDLNALKAVVEKR